MKIILRFLLIFFIAPTYAVDSFQIIENSISSTSLENSMNPWEVNFTQEKWRVNIENCYDRNVNQEAKKALKELLSKNGQEMSELSAREAGMQLDFYCSHVLSLADQVGIKLSIAPVNLSNYQVKMRADFIQSCYSFKREGFTNNFRNAIELAIRASREALEKDKNLPVSGQEVIMTYVGMCGALFSKDPKIPVYISFTIK